MNDDSGYYGGEWAHASEHGHGVSFGDAFAGVALAGQLTGHSFSLADTAAAAIAIEIALDHGGPGEFHGHETGYLHEVPALAEPGWQGPQGGWHAGEAAGADTGLGREIHLPGTARDARTVDVLVWPHGWCGSTYRGVHDQIRQMAGVEGMVPFDFSEIDIRYLREIDRTEPRILPIVGSDQTRHLPSGWYREATGATHQWREFFGIPLSRGVPKFLVSHHDYTVTQLMGGRPRWVPRTILIVTGCTWWYAQTADYETRVAFSVHSESWVNDRGVREYNRRQFRQYRERAEHLAQRLREYLHAHPAPPSSIVRRRQMGPEATQPE
jgi:hypothetical protein